MEAGVNPTLALQVTDILDGKTRSAEPGCEATLVVAARLVSGSPELGMTATTVVGVLGRDDVDEFQRLVQDIADEFELEAAVTLRKGSYSVRFSRPSQMSAGLTA